MRIIECEQRSELWSTARAGVVTASQIDRIVSPTLKIRTGEGPYTYLCEKLAERLTGMPIEQLNIASYRFGVVEQGTLLEPEALGTVEFILGQTIKPVGFITTDDGRVGCSPDGLLDAGGVEIKCPQAQTHLKYLSENCLPPEYALQVHGSMYVTGAPQWRFVSYHRRFRMLSLVVARDEVVQNVIGKALDEFLKRLDAAYQRERDLSPSSPGPHQAATVGAVRDGVIDHAPSAAHTAQTPAPDLWRGQRVEQR